MIFFFNLQIFFLDTAGVADLAPSFSDLRKLVKMCRAAGAIAPMSHILLPELIIFLLSPVLTCCEPNLIGSNSLVYLPKYQRCRFIIDLLGRQLIGLWCAIFISSLIWLIINWTTDVLTILSFRLLFLHLTLAIFAFAGGVSGIFGQYLFRSHQQMRFVYAVQPAIAWGGFLILSPLMKRPKETQCCALTNDIPQSLVITWLT